jgi:glycosyltransferase involved in cell wall biosynthesis
MKVLHLVTSLHRDGAQTMLSKLVSATDRERFDTMVVSLTNGGALGESIQALGVPVHAIGLGPPLATAVGLGRLIRIVRGFRPHVIQGWMYHANLAALMAQKALPEPVPVLWNIRHSAYDLAFEKPMTARMIRLGARLSRRVDGIVYVAEESAAQHEGLGYRPPRRLVIPNGFDTERFAPSPSARLALRAELGLSPSAVLIGLVARYHPMKDHATFLHAAARLAPSHPDAHFVLAGRGVDHANAELVAAIRSRQLGERTHLCGERADSPRVLAALDVASLASYSEGFPNVIGEAMACGVPCVVTDVGASATLVGDTGHVVPPRSAEALADGWHRLLEMAPERRAALGRAARRRIEEHFGLAAVVAQYEALYLSCAGPAASRGRDSRYAAVPGLRAR